MSGILFFIFASCHPLNLRFRISYLRCSYLLISYKNILSPSSFLFPSSSSFSFIFFFPHFPFVILFFPYFPLFFLFSICINSSIWSAISRGGGRKRLPKFKFSAKFPIGLHVILQIQIKKFENDCYIL